MTDIDPKKLLEEGLKALEKGDYEEADYNLGYATFLFFVKGMLKEAVESGKLALEVKNQLEEYKETFGDKLSFNELREKSMMFLSEDIDMAEFFYDVAQKMLKGEKLGDDIYRKFVSATAGIEPSDPYYEFVIEAERRIVEYMKSKGQKIPEELEDDIREFEESRKLKSEGRIILENYSPKAGFLCGEYYGKLNLSGIKNVEIQENDLGEVTYVFEHLGARFIIKNYGDFYVSGIKDKKHIEEIKRFLLELLEKGEPVNFYRIDLEDGEIEAKFYGTPDLSGLDVIENRSKFDPNLIFYDFRYKDLKVSVQYFKDRKVGYLSVYDVKSREQAEEVMEFLKKRIKKP